MNDVANGKPDTDDGWYKTAHEFGAAESVADFSKAERVILEIVKSQVFGPAKRALATINQSDIARRYGYKRQFVNCGLTALVKGNVLAPVGDTFKLNKHYRTWKFRDGTSHDNRSRFTDSELSQIETAPKLAMLYKLEGTPADEPKSGESLSTNQLTPTKTVDESLSTNQLTPCQPTALQTVNQPVDKTDEIRLAPIRTACGELETREIETAAAAAKPVAILQFEDPRMNRLVADVTEIAEAPDLAARVARLVETYGIDNVEQAFLQASDLADLKNPWAYVRTVLRAWKADDISHKPKRIPDSHKLYVMQYPPRYGPGGPRKSFLSEGGGA